MIEWNGLEVQVDDKRVKSKRRGKLTNETQTALLHTVNAILEIIQTLLKDSFAKFDLLGKFQTDYLEERFGQYRRMSGACYNISVSQVFESERKLKALSLIKVACSK